MARYDTSKFMAAVIRDAKIPAGSSYRDAETLLGLASDEMEALVVPELIKVTGDHLMAYQDVGVVTGKTRYRFPPRSIRPERLQIVNSEGRLLGKLHLASGDLVDEVLAGRCPPGDALGYWVPENNHAVVVFRTTVDSSTGRQLRIYYRKQPNRLISTESCWRMVGVDTTNRMATYAAINADEDPGDVSEGIQYDLVKATPVFEAFAEDATPTAVDTILSSVTLLDTDMTEAEDGDFIAPASYTPVPQLPVAFHGVLVAYTVARVLREMGNQAGADAAFASAQVKLNTALTTITPIGGESETTVNDVWGV